MSEKPYRICKTCAKLKPCYPFRKECCDCFQDKQKKRALDDDFDDEYSRNYYQKNRERCLEYYRAYYARQRAELVATRGVIIKKKKLTKEQRNARERARYAKNIVKMRVNAATYRERKRLKNKPKEPIKLKDILQIIIETEGKCGNYDCKKCPLNYRDSCRPDEITMEAKRLISEKAIRD